MLLKFFHFTQQEIAHQFVLTVTLFSSYESLSQEGSEPL